MAEGGVTAGGGAELIDLLRRHASFASLGDVPLEAIIAKSPIDQFDGGVTLFVQGDHGRHAWLVLAGELSVEVRTETGLVTVAVLGPGDLVGEIAAFSAMPRTASVHAVTPARLLRLEQETIHGLLAANPGAFTAVIGELGRRLERLNGTIATLIQAAAALAEGAFQPAMLRALKEQADRLSHFADAFETMAAEISQKRLLRQEMDTAATIQRSFLPEAFDPATTGDRCSVFAAMVPAKHVGGDFYDYFTVGDRHLVLAVGDVSGKGVPAAIFMSMARTMLKAMAMEGDQPGRVLARLNELICREARESMFVTIFLARVDLETGMVEFAGAGHEDAYVLPAGGDDIEQLAPTGPAAGIFNRASFGERTRLLQPGDMLFLATDGVFEAFNGDGVALGRDALETVLRERRDSDPKRLVETVHDLVDRFAAGAPRSDDTTCLAAFFRGATERPLP